jgi:hypothetical protein
MTTTPVVETTSAKELDDFKTIVGIGPNHSAILQSVIGPFRRLPSASASANSSSSSSSAVSSTSLPNSDSMSRKETLTAEIKSRILQRFLYYQQKYTSVTQIRRKLVAMLEIAKRMNLSHIPHRPDLLNVVLPHTLLEKEILGMGVCKNWFQWDIYWGALELAEHMYSHISRQPKPTPQVSTLTPVTATDSIPNAATASMTDAVFK